jgi:hypothetical protein
MSSWQALQLLESYFFASSSTLAAFFGSAAPASCQSVPVRSGNASKAATAIERKNFMLYLLFWYFCSYA